MVAVSVVNSCKNSSLIGSGWVERRLYEGGGVIYDVIYLEWNLGPWFQTRPNIGSL